MLPVDPLWYKDAIFYEVHVRCFADSDGDGIGDFRGLTQKLDYLQDLGVTAIWLLPFYPSPLKDDGYDIADYNDVHPSYGTLADFKLFLREAHRRNLKVITELVINHTSDQHPWFQRARRAQAGSRHRNYYVWHETTDRYKEARIIFQDFESSNWTWDTVAESYYWHRFYSHQPDLNFDNPDVQEEIFKILSFWLRLGVDGVRLDAVPYLFEREGTTCENLPETHLFLKSLRKHVDTHFENRMFLAEANQWPEDASKYFGDGDECHMAFHFPLMPRLFMSIHLEDSLPLIEITQQTPPIPGNCQWALFLRNHDELTLEMVTDEERDYMFRVYANDPQARINLGIRHRLAPLLKNDRRKIELMNSLLFSLIGTPVIYYGDEIGMGDNIYLGDRNGVRTPMQWSNDRNAGFSLANPQRLYLPPIIDPEYHFETVNVEAQSNNPFSLLCWTRQLIALRKRFKAFGQGATEFLTPDNRKVLVFLRTWEEEILLMVMNLSRFPQYVELDLSRYNGYQVIELFSGENFPKIGELPYFLTLGPYGHYWFALEKQPQETLEEKIERAREKRITKLSLKHNGEAIFQPEERHNLEVSVRLYLHKRIWFTINIQEMDRTRAKIIDHFPLGHHVHLIIFQVALTNGLIEKYPLYLMHLKGERAKEAMERHPECVVVHLQVNKEEDLQILYDAREEASVGKLIGKLLAGGRTSTGESGSLKGICPKFHATFVSEEKKLQIASRIQEGVDVDVETRLFLTRHTSFEQFLPIHGYLQYKGKEPTPLVLAKEVSALSLQFNACDLAVEQAEHFFDRLEALGGEVPLRLLKPKVGFVQLAQGKLEHRLLDLFETPLDVARQLGEMAAAFHAAIGSSYDVSDFSPIPFSLFYQRSLYQSLRRKALEAFGRLQVNREEEPSKLSALKESVLSLIHTLLHCKFHAKRTRYHGDFRLENLHYTGKHFLIDHFAGNPQSMAYERRYKRSPLFDVSTMLFSIAEASFEALSKQKGRGLMLDQEEGTLNTWALGWSTWVGSAFLRAYLNGMRKTDLLPKDPKEIDLLLGIFLIERCLEQIDGGLRAPAYLMLKRWLPVYAQVKHL